ncbi:hypothetical protein [Vibrio phage BONAISHI]|nr:hypothetical protein [Vibrio phage BONAISHI]
MTFKVTYGDLKTIVKSGDASFELTESTHVIEDAGSSKISIQNKISGKYEMKEVAIIDFVDVNDATFASSYSDFLTKIWKNGISKDKIENFDDAVRDVAGSGSVVMPAAETDGAPSAAAVSPLSGLAYSELAEQTIQDVIIKTFYPATVPPQPAPTIWFTDPGVDVVSVEAGTNFTDQKRFDFDLGASQGWTNGRLSLDSSFIITTIDLDLKGNLGGSVNDVVTDHVFTIHGYYEEGLVPNDSYGNPAPGSQLPTGEVTDSFTVRPYWMQYTIAESDNDISLSGADSAANRMTIDGLTTTDNQGPLLSFANLTVKAGKKHIILTPQPVSTINAISAGFPVNVGSISGPFPVDNVAGTGNKDYYKIVFDGQALDYTLDSVTIS